MRFLSVCSGIEAASVAWNPLGWRAAAFAEIEAFPSAVLAHHYPDVPNLGDMTALAERIDAGEIEAPELLCGGTPCQSFSVAGLRNSLADERGNLTLEFVRIADAIDRVRRNHGRPPAWVLYENVPGILNTSDNAFGALLGGLCGGDSALDAPDNGWPSAGVVAGPSRVVAWRCLDAQFFGLAQRRKRVFVLALGGAGGWACADALLPVAHSLQGHPAPSRQAGKNIAGAITASTGGSDENDAADARLIVSDISHCLNAGGMGRQDYESETFIAQILVAGGHSTNPLDETLLVTHSLTGEGFDASEDGTGRGMPLVVAFAQNQLGEVREGDVFNTINTNSNASGRNTPLIAFDTTQMTSKANRSQPKAGDPCHPLAAGAHPPAIAFDARQSDVIQYGDMSGPLDTDGHTVAVAFAWQAGGGDTSSGAFSTECSPTLPKNQTMGVQTGMQVRRLTPKECCRLQGFPDDYLDITYRGKPAADGNKYRALGNSWAVPVISWIGRRIESVERTSVLREAA